MAIASLSSIDRPARAVTPVIGVVVVVVSLLAVPSMTTRGPITSSVGEPVSLGLIVGLLVGSALIGAGLLASLDRATSLEGSMAILAGVVVIAPAWEAWQAAPAIVRSVAMVVQPFLLPLIACLAAAALVRRPWGLTLRMALAAAGLAAAGFAAGLALFRDPFLDPTCFQACRYNAFLVSARPELVRGLTLAWAVATSAIGLGLILVAARVAMTSTRVRRPVRWPMIAAAVVIGADAMLATAVALTRPVLPPPESFNALLVAQMSGVAMLAVAVGAHALRRRRTRLAITRLGAQLGAAPRPGTLGEELAAATGDATLTVVYPLPDGMRCVDAAGVTVKRPVAGDGRAVTPIVLRGRPVAFVDHEAATLDADDIRQGLGAAARLAIENERLRAEVLAQLEDLRTSRARVVETGDAERRRLERDLHDGAQQRLLALGYDLRVARSAALALGAPGVILLLEAAIMETDSAVADLRDLAHGIYPAILTEAGLGPALWSMTDTSPVPVELVDVPRERFADAVERTAFEVVSEGVGSAVSARAGPIRVRVARDDAQLIVEVDGAGEDAYTYLADRVGALGGRLMPGEAQLRAEIPCASS